MSVTLYKQRNYKGDKHSFSTNQKTLPKKILNKTSSIKMGSSTKALFYKKKEYRGDVMYRKGKNISAASSKSKGGKAGFGNTIASVRLTPIKLKCLFHIIRNDKKEYPGNMSSSQTQQYIKDLVTEANKVWSKGLVELKYSKYKIHNSSKYYDMKHEFLSLMTKKKWIEQGYLNVFLVNSLHNKNGVSVPACIGKVVVIDHDAGSVKDMGNSLAHECGHFLGIHHASAKGSRTNLMYGLGYSNRSATRTKLTEKQIEDAQNAFSKRNRARKARII